MEDAVLTYSAIAFLLIGLSHIFHPSIWVKFFILIREQGEAGAFINGLIHFPMGALIVAFHNVWEGLPTVLTLIGYGLLLKGVVCFLIPRLALRSLDRVSMDRSWEFVAAGIFSVGLSGLFFYCLVR